MKKSLIFLMGLFLLAGCTGKQQLKDQLKEIIKEDPSIVINVIKDKPVEVMEALQTAARTAQEEMMKKRETDRQKEMEGAYSNPLSANIREDELIRGPKDAPITLVEYSDFECPFCARGNATVEELMKKYDGKIRFIYKHLPLSFHQNAMLASKYFEAIRLQSGDKAWKFHGFLYESNSKLGAEGEKLLKALATKVGADMGKLAKDLDSDVVKKRIEEDMKEAEKFQFEGTPGFLLNGIPVKGAYPTSHFDGIIEELKKRGTLKL